MKRNIKTVCNMADKIEICINMANRKITSKYAKTCKIRLHILFNRGTLKWISMSSGIKYNLPRFICKFMNLRALLISTNDTEYSILDSDRLFH